MARAPKAANNLQVFLGSMNRPDVFTRNAGGSCCGDNTVVQYDKLAERTRFDNGLNHLNPLGANDKFHVPGGNGFSSNKSEILDHINTHGVGATISVLAIPTYAWVTGVGVHIEAEETGLTFNLITRNGLVLPTAKVVKVDATNPSACDIVRTATQGDEELFEGFGALGNALFTDIIGYDGSGQFSLEADEIILQVASMPASGKVNGLFDLTVSANYEVVLRAEA